MERLTTAYERIWVDGRMETQYVAKEESVMEIENKLGKYEDAEEEGRLFITPSSILDKHDRKGIRCTLC